MNATLLWLAYFVGGVLAFVTVYYWSWRIGLAMLAGGLVTGVAWALLYKLTDEEKRPDWVQLDLSLNLSFGLIFAGFGVALAKLLVTRREPFE